MEAASSTQAVGRAPVGELETNPDTAVRLLLTMIVKNEAATIARCLESALPHVAGYVICDTGSSDDTAQRIEQVATRLGKSGVLLRHEWQDFGHNRTLAAFEAQNYARARGWDPARTYLLFLDADMILRVEPGFDPRALTATSYDLVQDDGVLRYSNTRLACLSHDWRSVGVTHEYWAPLGAPAQTGTLTTLWIEDRGDGGAKSDKLPRDIALLTRGLEAEPDNARYMFYLANSYADSGRHREAIAWYEQRVRAGGWEEEAWYARYRQGLSHLALGEEELGAGVLLDAYQRRPQRAEPLVALARHYRTHGKNHLAYLFASRAEAIPFPASDTLFVSIGAHGHEPLEEIAISAYYVGERERGLVACEKLLARRGYDSDLTRKNELFYLPETADALMLGTIPVSDTLAKSDEPRWGLASPNALAYLPKNPAVVRVGERYFVNVCLVNYHHERGRLFVSKDPDGVVRTRSAVLEWQPGKQPAREWLSAIELPEGWDAAPRIRGLEDQRWVLHEGRVWFTTTTFHVPGAAGEPRVALGRMHEDLSGPDLLVALKYERATRCEKNWIPWSLGGRLYLLYSYDPFVVLRVEPSSGECTEVTRLTPLFAAKSWRGGAPPVPHPHRDGRFVGLVHETVWLEDRTHYLHRWVEFEVTTETAGPAFRIARYSRLFSFEHHGVEYACGLADHGDGTLLVTYGSEEREAHWALFDWDEVERMLAQSVAFR